MKKYIVPTVAVIITLSSFVNMSCSSSKTKEESVITLIHEGRINEAKQQFETKADVLAVDEFGNTALHAAVTENETDLIEYLLIKGADPSIKNYNNETPLHIAIATDNYKAAQVLIDYGSDIFAKDISGTPAIETALNKNERYYDIMICRVASKNRYGNGNGLVHYFVETKNLPGLERCIAKDIPLDEKNEDGITPLALAEQHTDDIISISMAAQLLKEDVQPINKECDYFEKAILARNLNIRLDDGMTPLHIACATGHTGVEEYLLQNGADSTMRDTSGATPLHNAVRYGQTQAAEILLNNGANINAPDALGKTPLLLIIPAEKQTEIYELLVSRQADIKAKDMYGDTVLHSATLTAVSTNVLQMMVLGGADVNARNKQGVTPLSLAVEQKNIDHIDFYTSNNADIHAQDEQGQTPLTKALNQGSPILEHVVTAANCNTSDSSGNTALHVAIRRKASIDQIAYILDQKADINRQNKEGNSPLYLAIEKDRRDIGELLMARNANIFTTNTQNISPLRLALTKGGTTADWVLSSSTIAATDGSGNTVLHYAAEWQLPEATQLILTKGANPNAKNTNGETPLFSGAKINDGEIVSLLVNNGADITTRDNRGNTPLHTAIRWDTTHAAQTLIDLGIDVNAQNQDGQSPLAAAASADNQEMAKLLLSNGADVNSADNEGKTVLIDAIRTKNKSMVSLLLREGANTHLQELNGQNAYHEAVRTGDETIIKDVYAAGANPLSRDKNGITPFTYALQKDYAFIRTVVGNDRNITDSDGNSFIHIAVQNKTDPELISRLISHNYPFDSRNAHGETPLYIAMTTGQTETAEKLLKAGANPFTTTDKSGTSPVTISLENADKTLLEYIVKYNGPRTDMKGNSILHYAAKTADADTVNKLLELGVDPSIKNIAGETAYDVAMNWQHTDIAALLSKSTM